MKRFNSVCTEIKDEEGIMEASKDGKYVLHSSHIKATNELVDVLDSLHKESGCMLPDDDCLVLKTINKYRIK